MPLMKTTWLTQMQRHSFSESWFRQASTPDPKIELAAARQYAVERAKLLGAPCTIYAIRITNVDDKAQKAYLEYVDYRGNFTETPDGEYKYGAAASAVALNMEFVNQGNTQEKLLQLRGFWDQVELDGGVFNSQDPVYIPLIQGFGAKVVALEYGWQYAATKLNSNISGYTIDSNGLITFTLAGNFFTDPEVASHKNINVRISKNQNSANLNGQLTVYPLTNTTCRTNKPIAAFPFVAGGVMTRITKGFTRAFDGRVQRIGKRQAGAPLLQSVGRGPARVRG